MSSIINRLKEGSSWAAISGGLFSAGATLPAPYNFAAYIAGGLAGLAAFFLKDKGAAA